jgi:nucleotide-binding universal stress UspA family protein
MAIVAVPVDGTEFSERALASGETLAAALGGTLVLVTVSSAGVDPLADEHYLEALARELSVASQVRALQTAGKAEDAILRALADIDDRNTLVCMAAHGRVRTRLPLASVSDALVRLSPYPMVLVGPDAAPLLPPVGRMIVCLDGSSTAEAVLPVAADLGRALGAHLTLLHVLEKPHSGHVIHGYLADLARELQGIPVHVAVHTANGAGAATVIREHAAETGAALVAMATHGRSGVDRALHGSVVQSVVHRGPCPVVVVNAGR